MILAARASADGALEGIHHGRLFRVSDGRTIVHDGVFVRVNENSRSDDAIRRIHKGGDHGVANLVANLVCFLGRGCSTVEVKYVESDEIPILVKGKVSELIIVQSRRSDVDRKLVTNPDILVIQSLARWVGSIKVVVNIPCQHIIRDRIVEI